MAGASTSTVAAMRWQALFDDLEAQLDAQAAAELWSEVAERSRAERASVHLADRLRAHDGEPLALRLRDGTTVAGVTADVAVEWLAVQQGRSPVLVPLGAVVAVGGLSRSVAPEPGAVLRRLGLASALRALARDRAPVRLRLDGADVSGTIDRVAADHLDLAEHPLDEPRRAATVRQVLAVPFSALLAVHSHP